MEEKKTKLVKRYPRALNMAWDIKELAESLTCERLRGTLLNMMCRTRILLLEDETMDQYFRKTLFEIRQLLHSLPVSDAEFSYGDKFEKEVRQLCHVLQTRLSKARESVDLSRLRALENKLKFRELEEGDYVQVAVNLKHKLRCILMTPKENVVDILMKAKRFRRLIQETSILLNSMNWVTDDLKTTIRCFLRKIIVCLAVDAFTALKLQDAVNELKELLEDQQIIDSNFTFTIKRLNQEVEFCIGECDEACANGNFAYENITGKMAELDRCLEESKSPMWPWTGMPDPNGKNKIPTCDGYIPPTANPYKHIKDEPIIHHKIYISYN